MKKKFCSILLLTAPFLMGCFGFVLDDYGHDMPSFFIPGLDDSVDGVRFALAEGVDLEIDFGLYDINYLNPPTYSEKTSYVFLIGSGEKDQVFECLTVVAEPYEDCYWTYSEKASNPSFSKNVNIHLGSERFDSENEGTILIKLANVNGSLTEKDLVPAKDVCFSASGLYDYKIDGLIVTLTNRYLR